MSFRIIFKGQIPEEFVEDTIGRSLAEKWESNTLSGRISINNNIYDATSIKAIISGFSNPDKSKQNEANIKEIEKIRRESEEFFARTQKIPPEERARDTGLAEILYMANTGKRMPQEVKEKIRERQYQFFKEFPHFAEAKPTCYKDLIPPAQRPNDIAPSIGDLLGINMLHFAERVVSNGIQNL